MSAADLIQSAKDARVPASAYGADYDEYQGREGVRLLIRRFGAEAARAIIADEINQCMGDRS